MFNSKAHSRFVRLALTAGTLAAVAACSKNGPDVGQVGVAASSPTAVAMAQTGAVAPFQVAPVGPVPNASSYEQGRRDQERQDAHRIQERREHEQRAGQQLAPRANRDADYRNENGQPSRRNDQVALATCQDCGVIESFDAVQVQGQSNGVGAVAGGLGGALVGNRIAGNHNRALGGVIGAVGGGLLGNAIEKHERVATAYDVHVRMSDGSIRTIRQSAAPAVGARVRVDADGLHDRG